MSGPAARDEDDSRAETMTYSRSSYLIVALPARASAQRRVEDPAVAERVAEGGEAGAPERVGRLGLGFAAEARRLGEGVVDVLGGIQFEADRHGHRFAGDADAGLAELGESIGQHHRAAVDAQLAMEDAQAVERRHEGHLLGGENGFVEGDGGEGGRGGEIGRNGLAHLRLVLVALFERHRCA